MAGLSSIDPSDNSILLDALAEEFNMKLSLEDFDHKDSWNRVGEGNFSIVYEVNCPKLDEKVALKELKDIKEANRRDTDFNEDNPPQKYC
ncbi:hypothetical protein HOLleu_07172 [Holothuria leucospilota]|uniref:Uncharacterized protein n=1 Tax=Holothuria leucospilota TaxID=206669 RepID=A0A9Q1HFF8_HOLLE|nr:hypothetical protein HOLleu_07172 [Holothuria leucospilota]